MATAIAEKTIKVIFREEYENGLVAYTVQSSRQASKFYTTRIRNGHAIGCTCPATVKCYHQIQLEQAERERTNDTMQHVRDEEAIHSCIHCGKRMKVDGWCGC